MNNRALALDALRGYAIITMVLSATIVTHVLPGWMSHAQTPPPDHVRQENFAVEPLFAGSFLSGSLFLCRFAGGSFGGGFFLCRFLFRGDAGGLGLFSFSLVIGFEVFFQLFFVFKQCVLWPVLGTAGGAFFFIFVVHFAAGAHPEIFIFLRGELRRSFFILCHFGEIALILCTEVFVLPIGKQVDRNLGKSEQEFMTDEFAIPEEKTEKPAKSKKSPER